MRASVALRLPETRGVSSGKQCENCDYRDWIPLVFAAGVIAALHLAFDLLQRGGHPVWVFANEGGASIVLVHAAFVIIETALLVWMAIQLRIQIEAMGGDPTELSRASRELANGNLTVGIQTAGASPTSLVCAMESMRAELKKKSEREAAMIATIAEQNATLEFRVVERTTELNRKTSDINAMLQNMKIGVSTVVPGNCIHPEYSTYLRTIFNVDEFAGTDLVESLFSHSSLGVDAKDQISVALGTILGEDPMMFDFNSHLLAREVHLTGQAGLENASSGARRISHKVVQMDWSPIVNRQGTVEKVLLITQDVTHLRELEESAALRKDELDIISKLIRVPAEKFNDFVDSASRYIAENRRLITAAASRDPEVVAALFRNMHTVKGNARMFEFTHITNAAHHAEHTYELLRASGTGVLNVQTLHDELNAVEAGVAQYLRVNEDTLGRRRRTTDMLASRGAFVADEQLAALRAMAASVTREHPNADVVQLQREIDQLGLVSLAQIVSGAAESLSSLARELNKPTPTLEMANVDVALNRRFAAALESCCVHIFRNSLDHGIERPRDRTMANKPAPGRLHFTCEQLTGQLELRIGDDGQGLALQRLYERGKAAGLFGSEERPSRAAVADLIFHAGLSTAARVTQVSGRGVGMDAVRKLLEDQGATIRIALEELSGVEFGFAPFELVIHVPSAAYSR